MSHEQTSGPLAKPTGLSWSALSQEPFRIFFPLAVLVGMTGAALWPLHFAGVYTFYPGQIHARLMAYGFFGGFILGFLGTALPRMLSVKPLASWEAAFLMAIYGAMVAALLATKTAVGDGLFVLLLI